MLLWVSKNAMSLLWAVTLALVCVSEALRRSRGDLREACADTLLTLSSHPHISAGVTPHIISKRCHSWPPWVLHFCFKPMPCSYCDQLLTPLRLCSFPQLQRRHYFSVLFNGKPLRIFVIDYEDLAWAPERAKTKQKCSPVHFVFWSWCHSLALAGVRCISSSDPLASAR